MSLKRKVICALDVGELDEAIRIVHHLRDHVGAFKIGHALTLPHGLDVVKRLQDEGAERIFLDLKFHDIPNSVALAVREAARASVWMLTMHISGGPAMMTAAAEEAKYFGDTSAPLLMGVSVLTSLDQHSLTDYIGVGRSLSDQIISLSKLAVECGLDGVICPAPELKSVRAAIGHVGILVTPGIRLPEGEIHDQKQIGTASQALSDGADYLVIGRALMNCPDIDATMESFGLAGAGNGP
jgi:orotidine-5'-phosphate decarboxylase